MRNPHRHLPHVTYTTPRTHLPECPTGSVRVAIYTPAGHLSHVKFAERINGAVLVRLFRERVTAELCPPIPEAPNVHYRVTMPAWAPIDHEAYIDAA